MFWLPDVKNVCVVQIRMCSGIFRSSCGKKI